MPLNKWRRVWASGVNTEGGMFNARLLPIAQLFGERIRLPANGWDTGLPAKESIEHINLSTLPPLSG